MFLNTAAFNLAHWLFAYHYWAMSWRVELIKNGLTPDTYNCRLKAVNIVVSLINVLVPAIKWLLDTYDKNEAYVIVGYSGNICLAVSCAILVLGFYKIVHCAKNEIVNKAMIFWHIVAYFLIFTANIVQIFTLSTL